MLTRQHDKKGTQENPHWHYSYEDIRVSKKHAQHESKRYLLYASQDYCFAILRPIQDQIRAQGGVVSWFVHGDEITTEYLKADELRIASVKEVIDYNPHVVITPCNVVPHFFPGIKVQVFHGLNARKRTQRGMDSHFTIRGFFDLYCTQGPSTTRIFETLKNKYKHFGVTETGWSKLDGILENDIVEAQKPLENLLTQNLEAENPETAMPVKKPLIMLTSTFSKRLTCAPHLFKEIKRLVALNTMDWIVHFHPKMDSEIVAYYKAINACNYRFIETDNVMPYLKKADVMVSDTSSILQEFLQLERPVVTFRNRTPGSWLVDIQNAEELSTALAQALSPNISLLDAIRQYNAELHPYRDGLSSKRILRAIDDFEQSDRSTLKRKPMNFIRKYIIRRELSFWRLG